MALPTNQPSDAVHAGVLDAKRALRARVLSARDRMPAAARIEAARAIATTLSAREDFQAAPTLLLTLPFGSEWDTAPLLAEAFKRSKVVVLPRVNLATRMLELCAVTDLRARRRTRLPWDTRAAPALRQRRSCRDRLGAHSGSRLRSARKTPGLWWRFLRSPASRCWHRAGHGWRARSNSRSSPMFPLPHTIWRSTRLSPRCARCPRRNERRFRASQAHRCRRAADGEVPIALGAPASLTEDAD